MRWSELQKWAKKFFDGDVVAQIVLNWLLKRLNLILISQSLVPSLSFNIRWQKNLYMKYLVISPHYVEDRTQEDWTHYQYDLFNYSFLFSFYARPDVSFNIRLLKAVQLMEFPLLRQWITQIVNEYLKFGNWNFVFAISHVPPFTSYVVLRLLRILQRDLVWRLGQTASWEFLWQKQSGTTFMDKTNDKLLLGGGGREVMNSKWRVKRNLGHVVQIHVCCLQ